MGSSLTGQSVLITGAGSGIGAATSALLGGKGARLVLMDRHPDPVAGVVSGIREAGGEAVDVAGDVREYEDMESAVALAVEGYGGLDGVGACAGVGGAGGSGAGRAGGLLHTRGCGG